MREERIDQSLLRPVGVLELIDKDVGPLARDGLGHVGFGLEHRCRTDQDVVGVHQLAALLFLRVPLMDPGHERRHRHAVRLARIVWLRRGSDEEVARIATDIPDVSVDLVYQFPDLERRVKTRPTRKRRRGDPPAQDLLLDVCPERIGERNASLPRDGLIVAIPSQHVGTEAVDRAHVGASKPLHLRVPAPSRVRDVLVEPLAQAFSDPLPELARRLAGEGNQREVLGRSLAAVDEFEHRRHSCVGLARARPRRHHGATVVEHVVDHSRLLRRDLEAPSHDLHEVRPRQVSFAGHHTQWSPACFGNCPRSMSVMLCFRTPRRSVRSACGASTSS